jgi:hypothetical protein
MKFEVVALTTLLSTMGITVPVTAQIQRPSQDFFDQGRQRLEREIQILQGGPLDIGESLQEVQSEPSLEVPPSPESYPSAEQNEVETSSQKKPNEVNNAELQPNGTKIRK